MVSNGIHLGQIVFRLFDQWNNCHPFGITVGIIIPCGIVISSTVGQLSQTNLNILHRTNVIYN